MKNILLINHARERSGWGKAAIEYARALSSVANVAMRTLRLGEAINEIPADVLALEDNHFPEYDAIIQNINPNFMEYSSAAKACIGLYFGETSNIRRTSGFKKLDLMDELWVPNETMRGNTSRTERLFPVPYSPSKYENKEKVHVPQLADSYNFYYIGDYTRRKNLNAIIRAFYLEFHRNEPVNLVLKVNKHGWSPEQLRNDLDTNCKNIQDSLRLGSKYKPIIFVTESVPDSKIYGLHDACDCFVTASFGEGWSLPFFDAIALGNSAIANNEGGPKTICELTGLNSIYLTEGTMENCHGDDAGHTGHEVWFQPSISALRNNMREAYHDKLKVDNRQTLQCFSHENIGKLALEYLS